MSSSRRTCPPRVSWSAPSRMPSCFIYPGDQHLFADSSLSAYDPEAAALLLERSKALLSAV
ncbi:hypothetical protein [Salana multivorans]